MNIAWASIRCPVYGQLRVNLGDLIEQKHEPWRTHALYCLTNEFITASETLVIIGIGKNSDIVAMAWLSLPEKFLVSFGKTWAYIYHVYVAPAWRHHGLGTQAVQFACTTAMHCGFYQVLLSATDEELRKRFYGALGFRPVPDDPWLMSWNIEEPSHVAAIPTNILLKRLFPPLGTKSTCYSRTLPVTASSSRFATSKTRPFATDTRPQNLTPMYSLTEQG